jgi:hypothetical protein
VPVAVSSTAKASVGLDRSGRMPMPNYWPDDHRPVATWHPVVETAATVIGWVVAVAAALIVLAFTCGVLLAVWVGLQAMWRFAT